MSKCINCEHFVLWDNNWCCTSKLRAITSIDINSNKTINPEICESEHNCPSYEDDVLFRNPQRLKHQLEQWKLYK